MASDGSVIIDILGNDSPFEKTIGGLGKVAGTALKGATAAVAAATAAFGAMSKAALDGYADYEQLAGGVETLFKDSADIVKEYADNAYKTAGLSANQYMETVTSFSASLLQGLGGDTAKAAKMADVAITDMADNANKMGTDMASIQNAYQGFAKQNYTMLDNLKLGYGGTQAEMARLINESGVLGDTMEVTAATVNQVSFDKIIEAIHVVQTRMGITGTTAKEASETIQGSIASMGAAWSNFLTGMADDNSDFDALLGNLVDSVLTVADNIVPRIQILLPRLAEGLTELIEQLAPMLPELIEGLLPPLLEGGVALINGLLAALPALVGTLGEALPGILSSLAEAALSILPQFVDAAVQMVSALAAGIGQALPTLIPAAVEAVVAIVEGLISNIPLLVDAALQLVNGLAQGLLAALPVLVEAIPTIITALVDAFLGSVPFILDALVQLIGAIIEALPEIIDAIIVALPAIIDGIITAFSENYDAIADAGVALFAAIVQNLPEIIAAIVEAVPDIIMAIVDAFAALADAVAEIGANIVKGIWNGICSAADWLRQKVEDFFSGIVDGVKDFLGIHSPSRVFAELGMNTAKGFGGGFSAQAAVEEGNIAGAMADMVNGAIVEQDLSNAGALAGKTFSSGMQSELEGLSAKMQASVGVETYQTGAAMAGGAIAANPSMTTVDSPRQPDGGGQNKGTTVIRFTGSLAQLGRVLKPVIDEEGNRAGDSLIT